MLEGGVGALMADHLRALALRLPQLTMADAPVGYRDWMRALRA